MANASFTEIDLSVLPAPDLIEVIDYEVIRARYWDDVLQRNPKLVAAKDLEQSPANLILGVQAYGEMIIRARVNAAARAVLAPFAKGNDLDVVAVRNGITRKVMTPADPVTGAKAVMEGDASLLRRYLLSFDGRAAGSADRFLLEAYSALPLLHHARVNGRAVHNRRGDIDVVVVGPNGRDLSDIEMDTLNGACRHPSVVPEAVAVSVQRAKRQLFAVDLTLILPVGPDAGVIVKDTIARIAAAMRFRLQIGANVPVDFARSVAFSDNVIDVIDNAPFEMASDPYTIPVCTSIQVNYEIR